MKKYPPFFVVITALCFLTASSPLFAQDDDAEDIETAPVLAEHNDIEVAPPWFTTKLIPNYKEQYATGNWGGWRQKLHDKGVDLSGSYVFDVLGNPAGGNNQRTKYNHSMGMDLNLDLEKILKAKNLKLHISGLYRYGRNLSHVAIGNTFTVSSIYGSQEVKFYGLDFTQTLWENRFSLKFGRVSPGDDFACSPLYWYFVNNAIDGNPIAVPINLPFLTYPNATWGARIRIEPINHFFSTSGVYNGDPRVGRDIAHGFDFTMRLNRGVVLAQEFSYEPNTKPQDTGKPGHYKIGGYWHSGKFKDQYQDINGNSYAVTGQTQRQYRGNYGFYAHFDQMLFRQGGPTSQRGLTALIASNLAPDDINQFPFFIDSGLIYTGLIPKRENDNLIFGFAYGKWSRTLANSTRDRRDVFGNSVAPKRYEMMFEFSYRIAINQWLYLQPDIQYIEHPGGTDDIPQALVIGSRTGITF